MSKRSVTTKTTYDRAMRTLETRRHLAKLSRRKGGPYVGNHLLYKGQVLGRASKEKRRLGP